MPRPIPVDRNSFQDKFWQRPLNYLFASQQSLAPLVDVELETAAAFMPIVFVERDGHYAPMAMMSPIQQHNLFVAPDGQWLGGYIPAILRAYPFCAGRIENSESLVFCIDEESGLISPDRGETFYVGGEASEALMPLVTLIHELQRAETSTQLAVAALRDAGVIKPWPLRVQINNIEDTATGIMRIDQSALDALSDEKFLKLRKTGGLRIAYAQLLSMRQIARFDQLMQLRQKLAQVPKIKPEAMFHDDSSDIIRFD